MCESEIVEDPSGQLAALISNLSRIPEVEQKRRALDHLGRFNYLAGEYRYEKWENRSAWTQIAQIANEATERYCSFLHCINGRYVPRLDWLSYLTYELEDKPPQHGEYMAALYSTTLTRPALSSKFLHLREIGSWMHGHCERRAWIAAAT